MLNLLSFRGFVKYENASVRCYLELNVKEKNCMVVGLPDGMSVYFRKALM